MKYYINIFLIYAIIGGIFESILKIFNPNMTNGTLIGPWIPIYGFGACIIILIMRLVFNRIKTNKYIKIIIMFLLSTITLTLLEFISGNLMELLTGKIAWDYSNMKYNFGKYICLEVSLIWGLSSIITVYLINPILNKLIKKIPSIITYLVFLIFLIDLLISILNS